MDASNQQRVVALRDEIAVLQHQNSLYRLDRSHTSAETMRNNVRRERLLEIREELLVMTSPVKVIQ
jgi:hypothetical protein